MTTTLKGWISANRDDKPVLEQLGIVVGGYDDQDGCFMDCIVSGEVLERLDHFWGRFYWGLDNVEDSGQNGRVKPAPVVQARGSR